MGAVEERDRLLRSLRGNGISDETVLAAMAAVPREEFVPADERGLAYEDHPLPIGSGQTISQPFIVAYMTQQLGLRAGDAVLDVGTGSGYQAAVLAECGAAVTSVEIRPELAQHAEATLQRLGYDTVTVVVRDGWQGVPEAGPFDGILVAAVAEDVPQALLDQLRPPDHGTRGGRLIIPLVSTGFWSADQRLVLFERTEQGVARTELLSVRFVPLIHGS